MSDSIEEKVVRFHQKLLAQAELYRALLGLTKRQAQAITRESMDAFVQLLEEKKKIVEEIGTIELTAAPLREIWENHKDEVSGPIRAQLRAVVDEIRALLEALLELESESQQKLGLTKDMVEEEIKQVDIGAKAMHSYGRRHDCAPRFMDENG